MKRPKTSCDPARDEYSQLTFFLEVYRKRFNNLQACSTSNSDFIDFQITVAEVVNSVDYRSASNMSRYN